MVRGVMFMIGMKNMTYVLPLPSMQEIWDQQQCIAVFVKAGVFLFLPPTLRQSQTPQQSQQSLAFQQSLLLLLPLQQSQTFQQSQLFLRVLSNRQALHRFHLVRRSSVWTRPTGWILMVMGVMCMKKMTGVLGLTVGQEKWDQQLNIAAFVKGVFEL